MRKMGGLRKHMPATYWTFLVATLALAGMPFFAGFFSKDEILGKVFAAGAGNLHGHGTAYLVLWGLGVTGAFLTAFYMFRAVYMTFHGEFRGGSAPGFTPGGRGGHGGAFVPGGAGDGHEAPPNHDDQAHHLHESPGLMVWPLRILAAGSVLVGFVGIGKAVTLNVDLNWFEHFLHPVAPGVEIEGAHLGLGVEWLLIGLSVGVAVGGILLAKRFYFGPEAGTRPARLAEAMPGLYRTLVNKYYVDEGYDRFIVRPLNTIAYGLWKGLDTVVIDGTLVSLAFFTEITGDLLRFVQTGNVRNYALMVLGGAVAAAAWLLL
jgi:NADH-quinone oxidoreductase subunit L